MHGIIFKSLKDYVVANRDHETWDAVRREAGLHQRVYLPIDTYDDDELFELVAAVADLTGAPIPDLLEGYGRFATAQLLDTYGNVVDDDWDALDLVANTEEQIHTVLRMRSADLNPPELDCRRDGDDRVTVTYRSERQLCSVARGIVHGVADHYDEPLSVSETECVHAGGDHCEIVVER
ncbi:MULTISPECIES: heme NO-binding domain-containing protein [Halorussus]|uniref:heme NO-binding domain-containing protein n=1 Tax=Halorussus TaxID=1070314 RepID=UPI0020A15E11|nr:heme NO-binding domain-containing protein [Halorussus vallis]USZ74507.1 heme NO-binding domain-containing protein [Halorussus vallis]